MFFKIKKTKTKKREITSSIAFVVHGVVKKVGGKKEITFFFQIKNLQLLNNTIKYEKKNEKEETIKLIGKKSNQNAYNSFDIQL